MLLKEIIRPKVFYFSLLSRDEQLHQNLPALVINNPTSSCLKRMAGSRRQSNPFICYTNYLSYFVFFFKVY